MHTLKTLQLLQYCFNSMKYLLLLLFSSLLLSACSTFNAETPSPIVDGVRLGNHHLSWPQRQAQLAQVTNWTASGNIAAHTDKNGWNASYHWHQQNNNYDLILFGPLGMNRVQLNGDALQATLTTPSQQVITANNPDTLLWQQTGWNLPVSNLYYWLRGLPAPHSRFKRSFDLNNHLVHLYQDGWHIMYLRYVAINGIDLPERLLISNSEWQVRLAVTQWQL